MGRLRRDAVLSQKNQMPDWQLTGFIVDSSEVDPLPNDPILLNGDVVGYVTSGGEGFRVGRRLALGYVKAGLAEPGRGFEIEILGIPRKAVVAKTPFYDPNNDRLRS